MGPSELLLLAVLPVVASVDAPADRTAGVFHEPNAVVINITEPDLNRIVRAGFSRDGGLRFEGTRENASKGIFDLRYEVDLSEPILTLGEDGGARLNLDIEQARFRIGRLERKIGRRLAFCENAGIDIDPDHSIDVEVALRFQIDGGDLRLSAENVLVPNRDRIRLVKPTRCENAILPTWLLWMQGKSKLRKRLGKLDEILLAGAHQSVERLGIDRGLLSRRWESEESLSITPNALDTSRGSLFLSLAGSSSDRVAARAPAPDWAVSMSDRSFVGLSGQFLNAFAELAFAKLSVSPRKPSGPLASLLHSDASYSLMPGLRDVISRQKLTFSLSVSDPPRIEFDTISLEESGLDTALERDPQGTDRAMIRIRLSGVELGVWEKREAGPELVGTVRVDSATVGVVPYFSILGGVSFQIVDNHWMLSSTGLDANEELLAATIQEMIFGTAFETQYDPLWRDAFDVLGAGVSPARLRTVDDYLVIELAASPPAGSARAPRRAGTLPASR
jgi:hypothetical protein